MTKLSDYLKTNTLTVREFAQKAGLSASFISEIANETKSPSLAAARKIQVATKDVVTVADWPRLAEIAKAVHGEKHVTPKTPIQDHTPELQPEGERRD